MRLYRGKKALFNDVTVAASFKSRLLGLLGRDKIAPGFAMYFPGCNSIHTFFMKIPIDVIMTDDKGLVMRVYDRLEPWKTAFCGNAKNTMETGSGEAKRLGIRKGDRLVMR